MKHSHAALATLSLCLGIMALPLSGSAQVSTECKTVRDCIDNGVPTLVTSCFTANPACVDTKQDKYAASAGVVATRAIALRQCDTKTFKSKAGCNFCFARAKDPLQDRFFGSLFHGLLAESVKRIEEARKAKCGAIAATR